MEVSAYQKRLRELRISWHTERKESPEAQAAHDKTTQKFEKILLVIIEDLQPITANELHAQFVQAIAKLFDKNYGEAFYGLEYRKEIASAGDGIWNIALKLASPLKPAERFAILKRDDYKCRLCGVRACIGSDVTLHVDHITPRSKGGTNDPMNLWTLCAACNIGKGTQDL